MWPGLLVNPGFMLLAINAGRTSQSGRGQITLREENGKENTSTEGLEKRCGRVTSASHQPTVNTTNDRTETESLILADTQRLQVTDGIHSRL